MDVFGYLESCRYRYHLDTADLWNGLLGSDPEQYLSPEFLRKVRRALEERGLTLVNYHADGCHIWEDDAAARQRNLKLAERHIVAAEFLGAKTVRIDAGSKAKEWTPEQFDVIAGQYLAWAKRAHDEGYRIGPENHWGPEMTLSEIARLAETVDHPAFGILLHFGRWADGDGEANDGAMLRYVMHTHLEPKVAATRAEAVVRMLVEAKYRGALGVECPSSAEDLEHPEVYHNVGLVRRALAKSTGAKPR
jgi:hypothetical protein